MTEIMGLVSGVPRAGDWEIVWNPVGWDAQFHLRDLQRRLSVGQLVEPWPPSPYDYTLRLSADELRVLRDKLQQDHADVVRELIDELRRAAERSGLERDRKALERAVREFDYHLLQMIHWIVSFADRHPEFEELVLSMDL